MRSPTVLVLTLTVALAAGSLAAAGRPTLEVTFIDTEGGQATLVRTSAGRSMLIDAGYALRGQRGAPPPPPDATVGRDAGRILAALAAAGISRLDYLLVTHFHSDHAGGVPEIVSRVPVDTFVDYGAPLGTDRMTLASFRSYEPVRDAAVRAGARHLVVRPGDVLPIPGLHVQVVSAGGDVIEQPLPGAGGGNRACTAVEDHPEDGTENYRSVGVMIAFGAFRFLDVGDLSGNTLTRLACPRDLLGPVSLYLTSHHGDYDTSIPALYAALAPRAIVMNNGPRKGGHVAALATIRAAAPRSDLWQLHRSEHAGAVNAPDPFLANVDDGTATAHAIHVSASDDGSFTVTNTRAGHTKTYRTE